jgi:hypothetical protein
MLFAFRALQQGHLSGFAQALMLRMLCNGSRNPGFTMIAFREAF